MHWCKAVSVLQVRQEANQHILTVRISSEMMFGEYGCQASNQLGQDSQVSLVLVILGKP